jgi:hypothetical protein
MNTNKPLGKTCWIVPDGYIPELTENDKNNGSGYLSHECVCILNTACDDVEIALSIYFEDCEPVFVDGIVVASQRSCHLRMDELKKEGQLVVPRAKPYSLVVSSSGPVVVQMSRLDTTQNNMAFLSTIAFPVDEN